MVNEEDIICPIANTLLATGGSGKERNLIRQPKEGVGGKIIKEKKTPLNTEGIRVMTPTEWGRLQGFIGYAFMENGIDKFHFPDNLTDQQKYKQFGNSVSIPVIKTMAEYMLDCFNTLENYQAAILRNEALNCSYLTFRSAMDILDISRKKAIDLLEEMANRKELYRVARGNKIRYILYPERLEEAIIPPFNQREALLTLAENKETFTVEDILKYIKATPNSAHVLLSEMVKDGAIKRVKRGIYSLK